MASLALCALGKCVHPSSGSGVALKTTDPMADVFSIPEKPALCLPLLSTPGRGIKAFVQSAQGLVSHSDCVFFASASLSAVAGCIHV